MNKMLGLIGGDVRGSCASLLARTSCSIKAHRNSSHAGLRFRDKSMPVREFVQLERKLTRKEKDGSLSLFVSQEVDKALSFRKAYIFGR